VPDPIAEIEALTAFGPRPAGSDAERRAANHLQRRLTRLGRDSSVEPILMHPRWYLAHLTHALLAIAGSAISVGNALIGTILVAIAAISTLGDVSGRLLLARRLTGRRASQNVSAADPSGAGSRPGTLVLTAHYDSARTGAAYGRLDDYRAALGRLIHRSIGLAEPFMYSILLLVLTSAARLAGLENTALSAVQFVPTVVLIVYVPFLVDIALSSPGPGANDNASGVATVLRLAERYGGTLDHFDVDVLLTGAQEPGALGMRAWLRRHRKEVDPLRTIIVNVDEVGAGTVRYAAKEGPLLALRQHPRLIRLCDQIRAEDDEEDGRYDAQKVTARRPGDAHAARSRGLPAITVSCAPAPHHHRHSDTPDEIDRAALDRVFGFCSELIELIDEEVGPDIAATAEAAEAAEAAAEPDAASFTPS
jgi:hypothetical protein